MDDNEIEILQKADESLPSMNVMTGLEQPPPKQRQLEHAKPERLEQMFDDILKDIQEDRDRVEEVTRTFLEFVVNAGDASTSSKEALVNLLKLKADLSDKKTKILDQLMRSYLKETNTFPKYLAAHQHNKIINIENKEEPITLSQRDLIRSLRNNESS